MSLFKGISYALALTKLHELCFSKSWSLTEFTKLLSLPTTFGIGDENGFVLCSDLGDSIEILTLAVHPSVRRQGIGSSLLNELQDLAMTQNKQCILLEVNITNIAAQRLYALCGFKQTGIRKNYYHEDGKMSDALCLTWTNPQQEVGD